MRVLTDFWANSFACLIIGLTSVLSFLNTSVLIAQPGLIFVATFESGDLSEWTASFPPPPGPTILSTDPMQAESGVALERETILRFSDAIDPVTATSNAIYAENDRVPLPATLHVSADGRRVTLFFDSPLPDQSTVQIFVEGDQLFGADGHAVDANGDGQPGGRWALSFATQALDTVAGTRVCGRVLASEPTPEGDEVPLDGVTVSVDGAAALFSTLTDGMGNYCLDPAPASRFFVHIDGTTAINPVPESAYYPLVGKAFDPEPGLTVHVGESFLPLIADGTLQAVSQADDTLISLPAAVLAEHPELAGSELVVPAGALFFDDGSPGQTAGIAPVPAERLPGELPAELTFPIVLTVQTGGATNLDAPAPVCFPNLPDPQTGLPLPAGAQQGLVSFDHDTGRWRGAGTMTVSADATLVCSDPGSGIRAPGWHVPAPVPVDSPAPATPLPYPGPDPPHVDDPPTPEAPLAPPLPPDEPPSCPEGLSNCQQSCSDRQMTCRAGMVASHFRCALWRYVDNLEEFVDAVCAAGRTIGFVNCGAASAACSFACTISCSGTQFRDLIQKPWQDGLEVDPIFEEIANLGEQTSDLLSPFLFHQAEIPLEVRDRLGELIAQANTAAGGDAVAYAQNTGRELWPDLEMAIPVGNSPHYPILYLTELVRDDEILFQRGSTSAYGQYTIFPPNGFTLLRVRFYDPFTHAYGIEMPVELGTGRYGVSRFYLHPVDDAIAKDFDGDQLADVIEAIYGSDPTRADTDGDGVSDRDEVIQGTDLLGVDIEIGRVVNGELTAAGERDRYRFAALAGQRAFFDIQGGATTGFNWLLMDADGEVVFDRRFLFDAGTFELTRGGTYTLYLGDEDSQTVGPYAFQIWNVPSPDTFTIAIGDVVADGVPGPGAGNIESPGREDVYFFSATAGQRAFADILAGGNSAWDWRLEAPDGAVIFDRSFLVDAGTSTLPQSGTYTLRIGVATDDHFGTYSFRLWDVPDPDTFTIAIDDVVSDGAPAAGAGNIESPGREDIYLFSATAGQRIFADILAGGNTAWDWQLEAPGGAIIFDRSFLVDAGTYTLPQSGTYTLRIGVATDDHFGTYSFRLWNVPDPDTFTIAIGDVVSDGVPGPGAGNIESPGREDIYLFSATAGQRIFGDILAGANGAWDWRLEAPDGAIIFDRSFLLDTGTNELPQTGTYTLRIGVATDDHVGTYSFQLSKAPS